MAYKLVTGCHAAGMRQGYLGEVKFAKNIVSIVMSRSASVDVRKLQYGLIRQK